MKVVYLGIILTFLLVAMSYTKPVHAESNDPVQILNVQVQPNMIKVNNTFSLHMIILNNSTFPIYLTSGSCSPAFSVMFDAHAKQVYPNIACTAEAILQKVNPQSQVIISNANKPGVIYQAVQPGTVAVNITLPYFAKNQTAADYSNIYYNTSKSFQFQIHDVNSDSSGPPISMPRTISPLKQFKSGINAVDIKCKQDFLLVYKSENNHPSCTTPPTALHLLEIGWGQIASPFDTDTDLLNSKISGGIITGYHYDFQSKSLVIKTQTTTNGTLTVTIPRKLLDAKSNGQDDHFYVLMNGQEIDFTETMKTSMARTLLIPFKQDTVMIEIIGAQVL